MLVVMNAMKNDKSGQEWECIKEQIRESLFHKETFRRNPNEVTKGVIHRELGLRVV